MTDLKPIQPSPTELLARQVQQLATLNTRVDDLLKVQWETNKAIVEVLKALQSVQQTRIVNLNMPFFDLVGFIVKASLAAIPAYVVLGMLGAVALALLGTSCAALLGR